MLKKGPLQVDNFANMVRYIYSIYRPQEDDQNQEKIAAIFVTRRGLCLGDKQITLRLLELLKANVGNSTHVAMLLAIISGYFLSHAGKAVQDGIYQSWSFSGKKHNVVLAECKNGDILLGDAVYGETYNLNDLSGRQNAIKFYKDKGLDGILFQLFGQKGWAHPITEIPMVPRLTKAEEEVADNLGLCCPISEEIMRNPVYLYSAEHERKHPASGGLLTPHCYEQAVILEAIKMNPKNPLTTPNYILPINIFRAKGSRGNHRISNRTPISATCC